ncbi:hypothetical protein EIN_487690 [Entamoeba invadens IP1]|uniref:Uncharacterized protein n=1 Tax=Entamoeba invadens IP1 TaxID=370355 RepID=A0A0A1U4S7_ENTIV|nr:hypothetical protein EIN_487690 [Entamoeba invadens IP1]ELP89267.1 hypothetical protein EIN_487690 [Entamoeba invadens IP1]|eukprot:XP_004256038.1 hypothetical protein EIN_487690 [Entamoeba invadens IP1]
MSFFFSSKQDRAVAKIKESVTKLNERISELNAKIEEYTMKMKMYQNNGDFENADIIKNTLLDKLSAKKSVYLKLIIELEFQNIDLKSAETDQQLVASTKQSHDVIQKYVENSGPEKVAELIDDKTQNIDTTKEIRRILCERVDKMLEKKKSVYDVKKDKEEEDVENLLEELKKPKEEEFIEKRTVLLEGEEVVKTEKSTQQVTQKIQQINDKEINNTNESQKVIAKLNEEIASWKERCFEAEKCIDMDEIKTLKNENARLNQEIETLKTELVHYKNQMVPQKEVQEEVQEPEPIDQQTQLEPIRETISVPLIYFMTGGQFQIKSGQEYYVVTIEKGQKEGREYPVTENGVVTKVLTVVSSDDTFIRDGENLQTHMQLDKSLIGETISTQLKLLDGSEQSIQFSVIENANYDFEGFGLPKEDQSGFGILRLVVEIV